MGWQREINEIWRKNREAIKKAFMDTTAMDILKEALEKEKGYLQKNSYKEK